MIEFMMPILNPEKPKQVTLTVANTLFGALSGVRPMNWGVIIHEIVTRGISQLRKKPSYISPFIMHLYEFHHCTTVDEDDKLLTGREEVRYKLQPAPHEDSPEGDPPIPDVPPSSPGSPLESVRRAGSPAPPSPHHALPSPRQPPQSPHVAGPSRPSVETPWQNVDLSMWQFPDYPFQRVFADLADFQTQYYRLEHITKGANQALNNCEPGNILRELTKRADRKELDQAKRELEQVRTENAHLNAQVASMAQELSRKNEEIRKHHAEHAVVLKRIRELIGQTAEVVTKARLYDHILESGDPIDAQKTIPILVKYSWLMNGLFEDIHKLLPASGTPRRVLYQAPPGSPSGTLYKAVGEVAVVHNPPSVVEPETGAALESTGKAPERTRSSQPRRESTGSDRFGRG